ncbi:MAG: hypothetical protein J7623_22770 [Chitinophaga sp.]|uniref:hypothetical protein n=1 Tax=Chitinophaga sp. TaxID=1869181 RepID=UPI001B00D31B|nr:hypothetical protein [Chitinophaga sp.]MBO9731482.1 hypothetical protein [Chitinophaga sp.]
MFDYSVLNVFIGLVFIFLLYSLFASAVQESLATLIQRRANTLYQGISSMLSNTPIRSLPFWAVILEQLGLFRLYKFLKKTARLVMATNKKKNVEKTDTTREAVSIKKAEIPPPKVVDMPAPPAGTALLAVTPTAPLTEKLEQRSQVEDIKKNTSRIRLFDLFYEHPIIKNYGQNDYFNRPSYLLDKNFSTVLIEVIKNLDAANKGKTATFSMVRNSLETQKTNIDQEVYDILNHHFNEAAGDLDAFKFRLEKWYNDSMDRVSGWYKRNTSFILFGIGLVLAFVLNIDTIEISTYLSANKAVAAKVADMGVAAAGNPANKGDSGITKALLQEINKNKDSVNTLLGLGWGDHGRKDTAFIHRLQADKPGGLKRALNAAVNWCWKGAYLFPKEEVYNEMQQATDSIPPKVLADHSSYIARKYIWYKTTTKKFFGFFITAIAITMGAPFWFDLLGKLVGLRNAGKALNTTNVPQPTNLNTDLDG